MERIARFKKQIDALIEETGEGRFAVELTVLLTGVLSVLIAFRLGLWPFGDRTLLYADGDQYLSYYRTVSDILSGRESALYTFRTVAGSGFLPTIAYYAASPFSVLFFFFRNHLIAGLHLIAALKLVAAAVSFCLLLQARFRGMVWEKAVFSAAYALSGYTVFFVWNLSWTDGVIALPLVCLGLFRLLEEKKVLLYILSLAYAILSNYYIGYMICVMSALLYVAYHVLYAKDIRASLRASFPRFVAASLTGVCLCGVLVVPAVRGIPADRGNSLQDILENMHANFRFTDFFSMFFTGRTDDFSANLPLVFCGVIPLLLCVLFFFREEIAVRQKLGVLALLGILLFSFWNSAANTLWHGGSDTHWFHYRYSFVLSFALLFLAFSMLAGMRGARISFLLPGIVLAAFFFWTLNDTQWAFSAGTILFDALQLMAGTALIRFLTRTPSGSVHPSVAEPGPLPQEAPADRAEADPADDVSSPGSGKTEDAPMTTLHARLALTVMMLLGIFLNATGVLARDVEASLPASYFLREEREIRDALAQLDGDGFYRTEKTFQLMRNDAALFGYRGVTNYSSLENVPLQERLQPYGIQHDWKWGIYHPDAPMATDAWLGIRHLLSRDDLSDKGYERLQSAGSILLYENPYALPLFIPADPGAAERLQEVLPAFDDAPGVTAEDAFRQLNAIWSAFDPEAEGPVFRAFSATEEAIREDARIRIRKSFTVSAEIADKPVYISLPQGALVLRVGTAGAWRELPYTFEQRIYTLGTFPRGTEVVLEIESGDPDYDASACLLYTEDAKVLAEIAATVAQAEVRVEAQTGADLTVTCHLEKDAQMTTTIPCEGGWRVTVDGAEVACTPFAGMFLSFPAEAGEHEIRLTYHPPGLTSGLALTIAGLLALLLYGIRYCRRKANE